MRAIMSNHEDLETQVASRKQVLLSEIKEHKMNSSRAGAGEAIEGIKTRLAELAYLVKEVVSDGWANVGPSATLRLEEWVAR